MREIDILITFCILLTAVGNVHGASNICDKGCELNGYCGPLTGNCGGETPYCCHRSWWDDMCVPEGFGFRECGTGEGYCHECNEGCSILPPGEKCGTLAGECSEPTPYCCKKHVWAHKCVEQGYDFGCCGGLPPGWEFKEGAILTAEIVNTDSTCVGEYPLKWEVRKKGETEFKDYSSACWEGNYKKNKLKLGLGESITLTCRTTELPSYYDGPHKARYSWCDGKISHEGEYGAIKCWRGNEKLALDPWNKGYRSLIYEPSDKNQIKKFCKCVMGEYGYSSIETITAGWICDKYVDSGDNENWDLVGEASSVHVVIKSVVCPDGKKYSTIRTDYYYYYLIRPLSARINSPTAQIFLEGEVIPFEGIISGGLSPYTYTWSVNGEEIKTETTSEKKVSVSKSDLSIGKHEIELKVTDKEGITSRDMLEITIQIIVGPLEVSIISPEDGGRYFVDNVPFKGEISGGRSPYTYTWSVDEMEIETFELIPETTVSFNRNDLSAGDHVVKLTVTDDEGVVSEDSAEITLVDEELLVSITSPKDGDAFVRKSMITFTSSVEGGTPPYTYSWDLGGGKEFTGPQWWAVVLPLDLPLGYHDIVLNVTDAEGRTGIHNITIDFVVECEKGPNKAVPCEFHKPRTVIYDKGQITVCDPEPPMKTIINEWILSDPVLREQVRRGIYDDAVRKIWEKTNEIYLYGYKDECDQGGERPASGFLGEEHLFNIDTKFESELNSGTYSHELKTIFRHEGHPLYSRSRRVRKVSDEEWTIADVGPEAYYIFIIKKEGDQLKVYRRVKYGSCRQWSAVLLSLIRTMGVSEHRVRILGFGIGKDLTNTYEYGHHVVAYQSDSVKLWILDITDTGMGGCGKLIDIDSWRNTCPDESVCQTSRWFYVNDHGGHRWDDGKLFSHACEYIDGISTHGFMPVEHTFPVSWSK